MLRNPFWPIRECQDKPMFTDAVLALHAGSTWFMTGLIWFVQIVHYPLFSWVGEGAFSDYEVEHTRRTAHVVGPAMLAELSSSLALLAFYPARCPAWAPWTGVGLLAIIWLTTFFISVPCHSRLARRFDPDALRWLVRSNWIRTAAWSLRAALVFWISTAVD